MPNDIQSVRYQLPMQAPRGFMSYAADAAQAYMKKKKEKEDAERAEVLAVAPTMFANKYLEPDPSGKFKVAGQGYNVVTPKEKTDWGNINSQTLAMRRLGQLPPSDEEFMDRAQFAINTNPDIYQAFAASQNPADYMTQLANMYKESYVNMRGQGQQTGETIRVVDRKSGKSGSIPVSEWDPNLYTKVDTSVSGTANTSKAFTKSTATVPPEKQKVEELRQSYLKSKKAYAVADAQDSAKRWKEHKKSGLEARKAKLKSLLTPGKEDSFTDGWMIREIADIDRMLL